MNKLLYLVSLDWGEQENSDIFIDMTRYCIKTIRERGNYTDDIMLLTYSPDKYIDLDISTIVPDENCETYGDVMLYKFKAREFINHEYDSILYLDTDIVAINDINPIFELPDGNVLFAEEFPINFITNIDFLTPEEKEKAEGIPRINAGTIICDGNLYHNYMEQMQEYVTGHIKEGLDEADQLPITAMILRGGLNYDNIPHGWVEFPLATKTVGPPPVIDEDTKLLHLLGHKYNPPQRLEHMKNCYELAQQKEYHTMNMEYSP